MESLIKFETPSTCLVVGPTGSGKTSFVFEILKNMKGVFKEPPAMVYYCHGVYQPMYDRMKEAIPNINKLKKETSIIPRARNLNSSAMKYSSYYESPLSKFSSVSP